MEELVRNTFGGWGYLIIPVVCGIFISFIAEALNKITPKIVSNHLLLFLVSIAAAFITMKAFPSYFGGNIWEMVFAFILNLTFGYVFYFTMGEKIVTLLVEKAGKKIADEGNKV